MFSRVAAGLLRVSILLAMLWVPTHASAQSDTERLLQFSQWWQRMPQDETGMQFDLLRDGIIDDKDLLLVLARWHTNSNSVTPTPTGTITPPHTPTPTPTSGVTPAPSEITINLPNLSPSAKPLVMARIPSGSFMMGRYPSEQDSYAYEDPQHQVNIGYQFYLGKYEITKAQWEAVMDTTPWTGQPYVLDESDSPAIYVTWNDIAGAGGFLEKLNALGQGTFRLPSEAEWEYACRAGTTTRFYWGNDNSYNEIGYYAWYDSNAWNVGEQYAHLVGRKGANAWGLSDMSGNVWEWCEDDWHGSYTSITRPDDGSAWIESPRGWERVVRGGDCFDSAADCRSARRIYSFLSPAYSNFNLGFRVVWTEGVLTPTPTRTATATFTPTRTPTPSGTIAPGITVTPLPELVVNLPNLPQGANPLVMVKIPSGSFMMGRYPGEPDSYSNEEPQHQVDIAYQFYLGKYEITKAQWQAVVGTTPWIGHSYVLNDPNSPAVYVSWNDIRGAGGFLAKLNALGQGTFRLPSEAEWEYACRATTTTRFYWGDDSNYSQIGRYAWYDGNAWNAGQHYAHVVGLKLPNGWGLYDMSGNVWEWCEDSWHVYYQGAPADGSAWIAGGTGNPVIRGGAWSDVAGSCRSASRYYYFADVRYDRFGLRVVRTP